VKEQESDLYSMLSACRIWDGVAQLHKCSSVCHCRLEA